MLYIVLGREGFKKKEENYPGGKLTKQQRFRTVPEAVVSQRGERSGSHHILVMLHYAAEDYHKLEQDAFLCLLVCFLRKTLHPNVALELIESPALLREPVRCPQEALEHKTKEPSTGPFYLFRSISWTFHMRMVSYLRGSVMVVMTLKME